MSNNIFFTYTIVLIFGVLLGTLSATLIFKTQIKYLKNILFDNKKILANTIDKLEKNEKNLQEKSQQLYQIAGENKLLKNQNIELNKNAQTDNSILKALIPVTEKLSQVQSQVHILEKERTQQFSILQEQLQQAKISDQNLQNTTASLAAALKNNSTRGKWGEIQLRRIVEAAGMLKNIDFLEQTTSSNSDNITIRPDMLIRLPHNKFIVLDSKVPLDSYLEAQNISLEATGPEKEYRTELLKNHAKSLKNHIDTLAAKKYWETTENSPEIVICFIPIESFLGAALEAAPNLLEYSFNKGIALASPVSLLAILKSIAHGWRQDTLTSNAKELLELSKQLYDRLNTLGNNVTKLGSSLKTSVDRYNTLIGSLETRILPTARKLNNLDANSIVSDENSIKELKPLDNSVKNVTAIELIDET